MLGWWVLPAADQSDVTSLTGARLRVTVHGMNGQNEIAMPAAPENAVPETLRAHLHLGFAHFWAGNFVDAANGAGSDGDADFAYAQLTVRF